MKRRWLIVTALLTLLSVSLGAQTYTAQIQAFWNDLRTGRISFNIVHVLASGYANFGATTGASGYGIRDNAGTMEVKNSGGAWSSIGSAVTGGGWTDGGTVIYQTTLTDNIGIGTQTPNIMGLAGTNQFVTLYGLGRQVLELATGTDTDTGTIGAVVASNATQSTADKRVGEMRFFVSGTTANNRGSRFYIVTRADNASAVNANTSLEIISNGNVGLNTGGSTSNSVTIANPNSSTNTVTITNSNAIFRFSGSAGIIDFSSGGTVRGNAGDLTLGTATSGNVALTPVGGGITFNPPSGQLATLNLSGLGSTTTVGLKLTTTTAASGGTTVQKGPALQLCGNAWNSSGGGTNETDCWQLENIPITNAGATTTTFQICRNINGGAFGSCSTINTNGSFTSGAQVIAGSGFNTSATASYQVENATIISATNPTVNAGFGTTPTITATNTAAFKIAVGSGGTDSTGSVTMPAATTGWSCFVSDITTPDSFVTYQTATTTTLASFKNYSRTTGLAIAWTAGDVLQFSCMAY